MSFVCDLCKKQFKSPKSLNYHQNKKVCEKFKCKNCNKIFTRNESLKYHLLNQVCGIKKIDNDSETGLKKIENDSETGFRKIDNDSETGFKKKEPFTGGASPQTSPDKEGGSWGEAPQPKSNKEGGLLGDSPIAPVGSSKKYLLKKKVNQKPKPPKVNLKYTLTSTLDLTRNH